MLNIGLSPCFMYKDPKRAVFGHKNLSYMENEMVDYVAETGHRPLLIPFLKDQQLFSFLDLCDGVLLQGGTDLSPRSYNEPFLNKNKWPGDEFRDQYELKIIKYCCEKKKPLFGICRGFQILNAYFEGTLYQDLKEVTQTKREHRCAEKYDHIFHKVILNGKILKNIYQKETLKINSIHHQGIKKLGKDLVQEAICPDDQLIEAFSYKNMNEHFILGVQWHPEFSKTLKEIVDSPTPLIHYFINEVTKFKNKDQNGN